MPNSTFLETFPLYRRFEMPMPGTIDLIGKPRINMDCAECGEKRTFAMVNEYWAEKDYKNYPSEGESICAKYVCVSCCNSTRLFYIFIDKQRKTIMKVGQFPAWSIIPDQDIAKMLGSHKDYLVKGLICESQSYGIAAFAYYRRITEEIIDQLLCDISDLISDEERDRYHAALEDVGRTRITSEKIDLIKDLLPSILRPDGMNPLALLHSVLSEGLHAQSDEDCLGLAVEVREILTFLASQITAAKASSRSFTDRMRSLLDKRSKLTS